MGFYDGITWACARRTLPHTRDHGITLRLTAQSRIAPRIPSTRDREAVRQRAEIRGQGYDFILQDAGGEMVMRRDCPEIGRERLRAKC